MTLRQLEVVTLVIIGSVIMLSVWSWSDRTVEQTRQQSNENRDRAVKCSNLNVQEIDRVSDSNTTKVFFKTNIDVDVLRKQTLTEVSAPVGYADVVITAPECSS